MKKFLVIPILLFAFAKEVKTQPTGVPDTLVYLNTIVANKAQFIGQPFSKLMDSLKLKIKCFSPFPSIAHDKTKETSTSFSFYFPQSAIDHYLSYPRLEIYWKPYLNANHTMLLHTQYSSGWTSTVSNYYSSGIVADIKILE